MSVPSTSAGLRTSAEPPLVALGCKNLFSRVQTTHNITPVFTLLHPIACFVYRFWVEIYRISFYAITTWKHVPSVIGKVSWWLEI